MDLDALVTVTQAALLTGMSKQAVQRWYERGLLTPADTVGGVRRYRVRDVLEVNASTYRSPKSRRQPLRLAA